MADRPATRTVIHGNEVISIEYVVAGVYTEEGEAPQIAGAWYRRRVFAATGGDYDIPRQVSVVRTHTSRYGGWLDVFPRSESSSRITGAG